MNRADKLVFVALGSNLGNSKQIISQALARLQEFSREPLSRSSLWKTTPVDCPPGSPEFLNAVAGFIPLPGETPETLLEKLLFIEKEFGRRPKTILNEARPLDLDLITFGTEIRTTSALTLPHPRAHQRRFVLQPLSELAPDLMLPGQKKSVCELLSDLRTEEVISKLASEAPGE